MESKVQERNRISEWYTQLLQSTGLMKKDGKFKRQKQLFINLCLFSAQKNSQYASNRSIEKQNIEARLYFHHLVTNKIFKHYKSTDLTNTNKIAKQIISLPLWEGMTQEIVEQIIMCLMQKVVSTDE